jgi:hypothetical protein
MLSLVKRILARYKTLMLKMHDDFAYCGTNKNQPPILLVMGLIYIMLLLESIHVIIKFV